MTVDRCLHPCLAVLDRAEEEADRGSLMVEIYLQHKVT